MKAKLSKRTFYFFLLRVTIVLLLGIAICNSQLNLKYEKSAFDEVFRPFFIIGYIVLALIVALILSLDLNLIKHRKKWIFGLNYYLVLIFGIIVLSINLHVKSVFKNPTLIRISFFQDFNGVEIDFKKDSSFIYTDICFGKSYSYGYYRTKENYTELILEDESSMFIYIPPKGTYDSLYKPAYVVLEDGTKQMNGNEFFIREDHRKLLKNRLSK